MINRNIFFQNYIISLKERTRNEKKGVQIGFDWIIYNLGIVKGWTEINLPFFRGVDENEFTTRTGAQYGIDMAFIYKSELIIFVLKDEKLNNTNWSRHKFDVDLRMAGTPDLTKYSGYNIKSVRIVLAYNKDEDETGIQLFNNLSSAYSNYIYEGKVKVNYERWNLSRIVEEVNSFLLTPDLLPQHLAASLHYLSSQIHDFKYCSKEWNEILLPNWKNFIQLLLLNGLDDKKLRLIPVCLIILDNYRNKANPDSYPAWIDLIEWSILAVWEKFNVLETVELRQIIFIELWQSFYLAELEKYLLSNQELFFTEHAFLSIGNVGSLAPLNDSYIVFWMIARIGILHLGFQELIPTNERPKNELIQKLIQRSFDWISNILRNNPAAYRPLIDLNHIELFLIWIIIYQLDNKEFMKEWVNELEARLITRRVGNIKIPFIEGRNRYDLIAEYTASFSIENKKPEELVDNSSYLLLMLFELFFYFDEADRDVIINNYWKHIILGLGDDDQPLSHPPYEIELQSWIPPEDWPIRIYKERVTDGTAVSTNNFNDLGSMSIQEKIKSFIAWEEKSIPINLHLTNPLSTYLLACLKNQSPLPHIFWRGSLFPELYKDKNEKKL